jgi:N-carbamoyl-L-amino-acid hydrolase
LTALERAARLFAELSRASADPPGVTRDSFGTGEAAAHAMIHREAEALGLETRTDAIGNLYVTFAGQDRSAPALMTGSHMDSVPHGGNFDGAAGVLAGFVLLERLMNGPALPCDVTLMVIRAEEMIWFPQHYLGSRAAFGLLPPNTPDTLRRADNGRSLADHMIQEGFDPQVIRDALPQLDPNNIRAFVEVHIEQGPVLVEADLPVGIVTGIRGNIRYRFATITGQTTHAGGVPRRVRRDAVLAGAELLNVLERYWSEAETRGEDMVLTFGEFTTDAAQHGITKVPGLVRFTLDVRSESDAVLDAFDKMLQTEVSRISEARNVQIDLGPKTQAPSAPMTAKIRDGLEQAAQTIGARSMRLPSGGGHDCAVFAGLGVPAGMLFVRNENGSHNPDEHMAFEDFAIACDVLHHWALGELFPNG